MLESTRIPNHRTKDPGAVTLVTVRSNVEDRHVWTTIYYLLEQQQLSRWHVVESDEVWHFYAGAPLELLGYDPATGRFVQHVLGDVRQGNETVAVIPPGAWQAARSRGDWSRSSGDVHGGDWSRSTGAAVAVTSPAGTTRWWAVPSARASSSRIFAS